MQIPEEIKSKSRKQDLVVKRALYAEQLKIKGYNYTEIGRRLNRSHSAIIRILERLENWKETNDPLYLTEKNEINFDVKTKRYTFEGLDILQEKGFKPLPF